MAQTQQLATDFKTPTAVATPMETTTTTSMEFQMEKTPYMRLHEVVPKLEELVRFTQDAAGQFVCSASIADTECIGAARSKKGAKQAMAQDALSKLPAELTSPRPSKRAEYGRYSKRRKPNSGDFGEPGFGSYAGSEKWWSQPSLDGDYAPFVGYGSRKRNSRGGSGDNIGPIGRLARLCIDESKKEQTEEERLTWRTKYNCESMEDDQMKGSDKNNGGVNGKCKYTLNIRDKSYEMVTRGGKRYGKWELAKKALADMFKEDVSKYDEMDRQQLLRDMALPAAVRNCATRRDVTFDERVVESETEDKKEKTYKVVYTIDGKMYEGDATKSVKNSKINSARKVLVDVFGFTEEEVTKAVVNAKLKIAQPPPQKNALQLLNELVASGTASKFGNSVVYEDMTKVEGDQLPVLYTMKLTIGDQVFEATGPGKKRAKLLCAVDALRQIYNLDVSADGVGPMMNPSVYQGGFGAVGFGQQAHTSAIGDHIANLVCSKYADLCKAAMLPEGKEVAGFVVTMGNRPDDAFVVSIASGTKCVSGGNISESGQVVNDCHAEILARRGLLLFFYMQLQLLLNAQGETIFEPREDAGYRLKPNVSIHLYISSAPCGDARIFSPTDKPVLTDQFDPHRSRRNRGLLRVKIESGMGTIPVISDNISTVQTWDAILGGERLSCMSCSDKVLRWNVLGVQGALLSHFVDPIYLKTIVLGSLFHHEHMIRACYSRMPPADKIKAPYGAKQCFVCGSSDPKTRSTAKAIDNAYAWTAVTPTLEILSQETGRTLTQGVSRVSKSALFQMFQTLFLKLSKRFEQENSQDVKPPLTYLAAKKASLDYGVAKSAFYVALQEAGYGTWARKPAEMDDFDWRCDSDICQKG